MSSIDKIWKWDEVNLKEVAELTETHNVYVVCVDKRSKTYPQIKFMYVIINHFSLEFYGTKDKGTIEELKNSFYADYAAANNLDFFRVVTASVTQMRMFLDWLIKTMAVEFGFTLALDLVEEQFKTQWIYALTCARICCVTGEHGADICHVGKAVGMGRDRKTLDHTKFRVIALSRKFHMKEHNNPNFLQEHGLYGVTLSKNDFKRLNVRGNYVELAK